MAIPTKKIYGRNGKLIFDPNNPEDVKNYREKQPLLEALKLVQGVTDPRTGGGLTGATRIISKAINAKMAKSKFIQNKAKQLADLVTKPMTKGKKAVTKKATPVVKEVVETKPTIPTTVPTTMELAQIPGSSVKTVQKEYIKSFKGTKGKFIPKDTERVIKAREILNQPIAGTMRPSTIPQSYRSPLANISLRPYVNTKGNPFDFNKFKIDEDVINKPLSNLIEGSIIVGGLGLGTGLMSSDDRLNSPKVNNKKTTSPVDLKRIDKSKLRDSNIEGVKTIKGSDGKDYGIKWNNTTNSWEYYKGDGKLVVKDNIGGGGVTPIKDNKKTTGTGGGTTTPRSATGQSFDKAFAEARKQAGGAGGIFEWNGKKYGTALEGETVPKNRVEVGKTTTPVTIKNDYPTTKTDPTLEMAMEQDSIRQQMATKPLSSLVFKPTSKAVDVRNVMDEQDALRSIRADNKLPLKKKKYGGNLAMLKYMK